MQRWLGVVIIQKEVVGRSGSRDVKSWVCSCKLRKVNGQRMGGDLLLVSPSSMEMYETS